MADSNTHSDNIIILGGGAGGLGLAIRLARKFRNTPASVILVDHEPTHLWKPLLHEVATGSLDSNHDEVRYVALARKYRFRFMLASAEQIDAQNKQVHLLVGSARLPEIPRQKRTLDYSQLVVAIGSVSNDFSTPGVQQHAILLDSRLQAEQFRQAFVAHLHRINNLPADEPGTLDIVIIGGGATGVELAADLHHVTAQLDDYGFESFHPDRLNVTLYEGSGRLLGQLPDRISQQVAKELTALGVNIQTGARVIEVRKDSVLIEPDKQARSDLTVWAAGIRAPELMAHSGLATDSIGRAQVAPTLNLTEYPDIFVIGDCAHCDQNDGSVVPPRAQSAFQMSVCASHNLIAHRDGRTMRPFAYHDFGSLVSLSDYSTIGNLMGNLMRGTIFIEGMLARLMYRMLYRRHQVSLHGYLRTALIMLGDLIHRVTRSRIKLH